MSHLHSPPSPTFLGCRTAPRGLRSPQEQWTSSPHRLLLGSAMLTKKLAGEEDEGKRAMLARQESALAEALASVAKEASEGSVAALLEAASEPLSAVLDSKVSPPPESLSNHCHLSPRALLLSIDVTIARQWGHRP